MKYNHIQRILSAAMLVAFCVPAGLAYPSYGSYSSPNSYSASAEASPLVSDSGLTQNNSKITLSLRDSDVKQVLRMFADKAGYNIVFHNSVNGKVTLDLVDMPINEAFNLVLKITNLNYYKQNNTLIVLSNSDPANATFSKQEMMTFPIKYVSATSIANFLNKNIFAMQMPGMSGIDAATVNAATNEIIVFGMPSDAAIVRKVIAQLDKEPLSRTFTVNHTTPAEMASLVCDVLLPSRGVGSSGSSGGGADMFIPAAPGVGTGGAAGIVTGGAASSGDGDIKLGEGVVACSASVAGTSSSSAAFDMQNLSIAYFPQRGTILVTGGSEAQMEMIDKFIKENDKKQPQAYIEVAILELNEDGSKTFQNMWDVNSKHWNFSYNGSSTSGGRVATPHWGDGNWLTKQYQEFSSYPGYGETEVKSHYPVEVVWGRGPYISWTMNYLVENKKGRVLANPKLIVTNGQESVIDMTQDYVEKVTTEFLTSTSAGSGSTSGAVERTYTIGEDLGIKVSLTPFISPEGYITMNLTPEYSTIKESVYAPTTGLDAKGDIKTYNDLMATLLSRRNLDLKNIRVRDGETLIIGGMIQEVETKSVNKIPVLGDLPLIGAAFRSSSTEKAKNELVIMITPKIIVDDDDVADNL